MPLVVSEPEARVLIDRGESQFWDQKSVRGGGAMVQKIGCALANADGGEFAVGIEDKSEGDGLNRWRGFPTEEDGNFIHQALTKDVEPPVPYSVEWLLLDGLESQGLVALVTIQKSASVHRTARGDVWIRRGAQMLKVDDTAAVDLALSKGTRSYEDQLLDNYVADELAQEPELTGFLHTFSPATLPRDFIRKQRLAGRESEAVSVAGAVLYAEVPSAVVPKKCAVKVARYETKEEVPRREHLKGVPVTVEGPARVQIDETIAIVKSMVEAVSIMEADGTLAPTRYPPEALKEVIVNAVIHRDYNISDDILVWVFDNRVEVRSPGVLPGHMTLDNLLSDRFSRNPTIVRLLNKYPDPPNKDIGEGLNTVFAKMADAKLQQPRIEVSGNTFAVTLGHTPLARPQELVMEYLESHDEITNRIGRELSGISSENTMKDVFYALNRAGEIERVPGKGGNKAAWRRTQR